MHRAVLAAVVAAGLFAPAAAQQINTNGQPVQTGQEPQTQSRPIPGPPQTAQGRAILPELLSVREIRDIQHALAARGTHSIRVDGQWGPDVEAAIRNFQKSENMISQNGELDALTLIALGLNPLAFGLSGTSETTGQAVRDNPVPPERMHQAPEQPLLHGGDQNR
jgi:peptidoglycan hydrolase-like protein with peptidoglycan-binding domain